jgi:hypothetical protein
VDRYFGTPPQKQKDMGCGQECQDWFIKFRLRIIHTASHQRPCKLYIATCSLILQHILVHCGATFNKTRYSSNKLIWREMLGFIFRKCVPYIKLCICNYILYPASGIKICLWTNYNCRMMTRISRTFEYRTWPLIIFVVSHLIMWSTIDVSYYVVL